MDTLNHNLQPQLANPLRLQFLAKLPTLINSSLDSHQVVAVALKHVRAALGSEAATVLLRTGTSKELTFWALHGEQSQHLEGQKISTDVGIVGWVTTNKKPVISNDVQADPRFFSKFDQVSSFKTRSMICVPLLLRGDEVIGAIQVLNHQQGTPFCEEDLSFLEQFAHQVAIALENARLYQELKTKVHQLTVLDRRKQEMITVLAHELRTPANVIQSSAEMLSEDDLEDGERQAMLKTLKNGISRLVSLVARIKSASIAAEDKLVVELSELALPQLFEELKCFFTEPLRQRELLLRTEIAAEVANVKADTTLITVAMKNLISNAIRFTPNGGAITIMAKQHAGLVEITVQDTGIGISESDLPLIFEKFFEVTDSAHHTSGDFAFRSCGLGLGLAATKIIIESHQSHIAVKSEPGKGSEFSFCLSVS